MIEKNCSGFSCPKCGQSSHVIRSESRPEHGGFDGKMIGASEWRLRQCEAGHEFSTSTSTVRIAPEGTAKIP